MDNNLKSNVKLITSGNVPTTEVLKPGEMAFGMISDTNDYHMYGNIGESIVELTSKFGSVSEYDIVIRTQAEFEKLYSSPDWLGAASVAFVGDGGSLKFTRSNIGLLIPPTVKQIAGFNDAIIEIGDFMYDDITNRGTLWYKVRPKTGDYSIINMTARNTISTSSRWYNFGFCNCTQLINCTGYGDGYTSHGGGFNSCTKLINCVGISNGYNEAFAFLNCVDLLNCSGTSVTDGIRGGNCFSFYNCKYLTNCTGTCKATDENTNSGSICFDTCSYLSNCIGTGSHAGSGNSQGFFNCSYLNNCTGTVEYTGSNTVSGPFSCGFVRCNQLSNCTGTGTTISSSMGFFLCNYLTDCIGIGIANSGSSDGCDGYGSGVGFSTCRYLTNCTGTGSGIGIGIGESDYDDDGLSDIYGHGSGGGTGFAECHYLTNCVGTGTGVGTGYNDEWNNSCGVGDGSGFYGCNELSNCIGTGSGTGSGNFGSSSYGVGFEDCTKLTNCTGTGTSTDTNTGMFKYIFSSGFSGCVQLSNCTGTGLNINTKDDNYKAYSYYNCNYLNSCNEGTKKSTKGIWGGTWLFRDDSTCQLTR